MSRSPYYGQLQTASMPSEVKQIWYSRDEELDPLPSWRWSWQHQTNMEHVEQRELLEKILESAGMNEREEIVLRMLTIEDYTLEEIGQVLGVTKERVRQMHLKVIRKLRKAQWGHTGIAPSNVWKDVTTWQHYRYMQQQDRRDKA